VILKKYINDPSEKVKIKAVEANPSAIGHIYNPNKKLQLKAIRLFYYVNRNLQT